MAFNAKETDVTLKSGSVHCITFGTGDKDLVMIPGLRLAPIEGGAKAVAWYYRIFAKEYRVVMPDKNSVLKPDVTIRDLAEDTAETMEKLGIRGAYVFGASQGGMIAQELAVNHPELVKKLVLGVTMSRPNETVRKVIGNWVRLAENGDFDAIARDYMTRGYSEKYLRRYGFLLPIAVRTQKYMPKERFIALAKACLTCHTYDELDRIECPVLVLGGGKDGIVSGEASREIAEKLGCRYHIYEDLSHEAYNEAKDFNQRIYDFFAEEP